MRREEDRVKILPAGLRQAADGALICFSSLRVWHKAAPWDGVRAEG